MQNDFHPGQRWFSESEPELGLGSILRVTDRRITAVFHASAEKREYARAHAPLRRMRFRTGDTVETRAQRSLTVDSVSERDGLIFYCCDGQEVCETELSDAISFSKPDERFLSGQLDPPELFDLRVAALEHQYERRKSEIRGFIGGRIELIPHQLYIASEVAGRLAPRVLLADEVGLGKTIEACLILHRLISTGRAKRVLILVPESLVHQWFLEMMRRFNLWFHIFDEERCKAIERANPEDNPFLDDQLVLCGMNLLVGNEQRIPQVLAAGWDILVVDEAHHLGWSPERVSPEYALVEALGRKTPGLLLLTATPEQLGMPGHFARLRLLDPDRFCELREFLEEAEHYRDIAHLAEKALGNQALTAADVTMLARILGEAEESVRANVERIAEGDEGVRRKMLDSLLDRHGTGRVSFRNTRMTMTGFPTRIARLVPLAPDRSRHERIDWLAGLLRDLAAEKVLLICRTQAKVAAIDAALRQRVRNLKMAVFHEGLSLLQRDRNAAWFADEKGASLLVCSEIGSEGRNFQFAHHLVLFDLPLDPEVLEQRIGRLDRIGQTSEIQVHVPFVIGSGQEVLARWYHEGLNSLEANLNGGRELLERFGARVFELAQNFPKAGKTAQSQLERLIEETQAARKEIAEQLRQGRDRLLELNSFRPEAADRLVRQIRQQDRDRSIDEFMLSVFDRYSLSVEELADRTYKLGSAGVLADCFPGLPAEGLTVTCDRQRALAREDIQFLTWDHPLVTGALDLLLSSEKGNSSFVHLPDAAFAGLYLEAIYVLECIAPPHLHVDRFLPPTPLRVVVDRHGNGVDHWIAPSRTACRPKDPVAVALLEQPEIREDLLPELIKKAQIIARGRVPDIVAQARRQMTAQMEHEMLRLQELQKANRAVRAEEIELLAAQQRALNEHLINPHLRLDAIRLIQA